MKVNKCAGGGYPAPFLVKTYGMVEDGATDDVISWGAEGISFVVWKPAEFASDLLPVHFKHNNFSSFIRQLNTYGFRKVVANRWEFANDHFRRGEQSLLCKLRRRKPPPPPPQLTTPGKASAGKSNRHPPPPPPPPSTSNSGGVRSSSSASSIPSLLPPPERLAELATENQKLRSDNQILYTELAEAKRKYQELMGFLSNLADVSQINFSVPMQESAAAAGFGTENEKETEEEVICKEESVKLSGFGTENEKETEEEVLCKEESVKLFGVVLKYGIKRGRRSNWEEDGRQKRAAICDGLKLMC